MAKSSNCSKRPNHYRDIADHELSNACGLCHYHGGSGEVLSKKQGRIPQAYRLLFCGKEIKSRSGGIGGAPTLLSQTGIKAGGRIDAVVTLNACSGKSVIAGAALDRFGNANGNFDLIMDGSCVGLSIVILQMYTGESFDFSLPLPALKEMGFTVYLYQNQVPDVQEFQRRLTEACQLWIISTSHDCIPRNYIDMIVQFHKEGKSLYIWGENDPFNVVANIVLNKLLPGVQLCGSYVGTQVVPLLPHGKMYGPGFSEHYIFTGIANLFEGATIARFAGSNPRLSYIMNNSEGTPALGICEPSEEGCGRIAVDSGFTRLFCNWNDAGTKRFVKNISGWLCGFDLDY